MYGVLQQTGALSLPLPAAIRRTATFSGNFRHRSSSRKLRFLLGLSFHRFSCPHSMRKPPTERLDAGTEGLDEDFMVNFESNSPVEICSTRILPPALTMSEAVERIREEMKTMKSELKTLASGVLRIQIALPPSLEPLNWLRSSKVFPQLYISATKMNEDIAFPNGLVEVVGIGAAVCLPGSSSKSDARKLSRYLSVDSPLISAYGFMGIHYDEKFSWLEHVCDSFYAIIPQIEVGKFKDCSFLALTLAWDRSELFFVDKAIFAAEQKLDQVIAGFPVMDNVCPESWGLPISELSNHAELKHVNTVYMNGKHQERLAASGHDVQIEQLLADWRVHFRLTDSVTLATDRFEGFSKSPVFVSESANINALWATLIVEELVRLGLTYFCIAPGSRSSPLAISASTHRLTSCISCFDERSLAFHAVGYARGSSRPAVVITSSGTAVSNLLPAVVEASQDFLPMLLLTADRPPELHDCGANQAINQVLSLQPELITLVSL